MKRLIIPLFAFTLILHLASAHAATYNLIGQRYLRLYTAPEKSQAYNAGVEAQKIANSLCNVPWTKSSVEQATATAHSDSQLDENVTNRGQFDAALFCAHHTNETHRAYANAAVYRYRLPEGSLPHLTRLTANVSSDPYNALGARIVLYTNATGEIPMDCATCRGDVTGGIKLAGVAPRVTRKVDGKDYWYPNTTNAVFTQSVQLQRYLFVFVLMENYASSRGNWLEGCSYMKNLVTIETDAAVPGWADGSTVNLMEIDTATGDDSLEDLMAYYETTQTVVTATHLASGLVQQFTAPAIAYRKISVGSTNLTSVTHTVLPYGDIFVRGTNAVLSSGWRATAVLGGQRVAVIHGDVMAERGFESYPPTKPFTQFDRTFAGLPSGSPDTDGDGIADGWELYVGGDPTDRSDGMSDWDNDGLSLAEEFDHGYWPTDPRNPMSEMDGLLDLYAYRYHLKGRDASADFDGDGLSNYAEYLITELFHYDLPLDPDNPKSNGTCLDYFLKMGDLYLGEIFTDHDLIDFAWEERFRDAANGYLFDPDRDDDLDGWPNFDEFMAGTNPSTSDCPQPEIRMKVVYNQIAAFAPPVIVKAWNEDADPGANYIPDAIWTLTNDFYRSRGWVTLPNPDRGNDSLGHLRKGQTTFIVYATVPSASSPTGAGSSYVPGAPLGVVRGVDVGFSGAAFTVELTPTHALCPDRQNLFTVPAASSPRGVDEQHVLIVDTNGFAWVDKTFTKSGRDFLCEVDFMPLGTNQQFQVPASSLAGVTNQMLTLYSSTTNTIVRHFDMNWTSPRCEGVIGGGDLAPAGIVHTAHPTFVWSMPDESEWASRFGSSYTAFKLRIKDKATGALVYESAVTRAPAQDAKGRFVWTAPISVGDQTPQGKVFANNATYTWDVAMFNAKFQPSGSVKWASGASFSTSVNAQQSQNDTGFSSIGVTVKYTGPAAVLDGCESVTNASTSRYGANIRDVQGIVRVQAYTTADFSGVPASETFVASRAALTDATAVLTNACLRGLAAGTYYVRAYVDMNGNFQKDEFESWGYAKEPVAVGSDVIRMPAVGLYIEDADTNGNWYPDAWEYAYKEIGNWSHDWEEISGAKTVQLQPDGKIAIVQEIYDLMGNGLAGISTGLSGSKITVFQDSKYAELLLDPYVTGWDDVHTTFDAIRKAVISNIVERANQ